MVSESAPSAPRPASGDEVGENPDYRFTLANERTFLAWVRTALALMAAGVAVIRFVPGLMVVRHALGFLLIGLGGLLAALSYRHWQRNEQAMRLGRQLPRSVGPATHRCVPGARLAGGTGPGRRGPGGLTMWPRMTARHNRGAPSPDVGLQAERTAMAWERTALGVGGVSALMLHDTGSAVLAKVPGLIGLTAALGLLVLAQVRYEHTVRRLESGLTPRAAGLGLALSGAVVVLAALSIGVIIVSDGA